MNQENTIPFDSIESAHEFVTLLAEAALEARTDIEGDLRRELGSDASRRVDALRIVLLNLEKLELYMNKSRRILNDLRTLRRLLFDERTTQPQTSEVKA